MVVLYVFRDSKCDAGKGGGWVVQKWQFQRDVIIEQPLFDGVCGLSLSILLLY